ncbi:replication restart DNA helicase PriA [Chrysosporum bergii ANA360D]|jgi:ribosomal protein S27E|uniref:Replication restart DNA helicase PriA n=1 Tax=Chrysosporum bergii ANA360D TaxID=617107 RepID=A0AA43GW06_9CYAN|nr:replication restart DNA helicase PriA [Chrysosporum bergii]MDH6062132.1 replication restart DNA helicase PriA [Chrysosporum bergii ANA360D]
MNVIQKIHCPNCGSEAERHYIFDSQVTRTQCPSCDYLMINCSLTGKVIEAYAPGINLKKQLSAKVN